MKLHKLQCELFPVNYGVYFYRKLLSRYSILAVLDGEIIGVITARLKESREDCFDKLFTFLFRTTSGCLKEAYIMTFGVSKKYRKRGLGTKLMQKMSEQLFTEEQCKVISLHVKTENNAAVRLYEKFGFRTCETVTNYYFLDNGGKADAYVLRKYAAKPRRQTFS
eukprot:TRINITY_DN16830_c0_g1_i1.p1 TRINITY_DN16830_c0_g1~~TRINITY_DN16830_c0_g1_i1.p1  ORF type:complete len:194 (-),score=30.77 TRINITY_DN16830_c0_g1_i1:3-497(-)